MVGSVRRTCHRRGIDFHYNRRVDPVAMLPTASIVRIGIHDKIDEINAREVGRNRLSLGLRAEPCRLHQIRAADNVADSELHDLGSAAAITVGRPIQAYNRRKCGSVSAKLNDQMALGLDADSL